MSFLSATGGGGVDASGGTTVTTFTDSGGTQYQIHAFENTGNDTFTVNSGGEVDVLVVGGGGGGGGSAHGGGGGAGGLIFEEGLSITEGNKPIAVGDGGAGKQGVFNSPWLTPGTNFGENGEDSTAFGLTALGGGGGGGYSDGGSDDTDGRDGGSGGGSGRDSTFGVATQPSSADGGFGKDGGFGTYKTSFGENEAGGGGGAGEVGAITPNVHEDTGRGGDGISFSDKFGTTFGESGFFSGGGGGSYYIGGGVGGTGGGGVGDSNINGIPSSQRAGTPNTGGGGGGAERDSSSDARGGDGGSGIVLIRYEI